METQRLNFVIQIIGGRGTGKTTFVKEFLPNYKKVLIVDTLAHPAYKDIQLITTDMIPRWKSGIKKIIVDDETVCELCALLSIHLKNGAVIFEDAGKYFDANLQRPIKKLLIDTKQQNNDVFIINHFWSDVSPKALKLSDRIVLFKTLDTPYSRKKELTAYELIKSAFEKLQKMPNKWDHITIAIS